jgi:hypothetical protein
MTPTNWTRIYIALATFMAAISCCLIWAIHSNYIAKGFALGRV